MKRFSPFLITFGILAILVSFLIFITTYKPLITYEIGFLVNSQPKSSTLPSPVDEQFGIVIPKIGANSKVIAGVDPFKESEYQVALTRGVAHAKGTALPGEPGNTFIFSHSSANFYESVRFNSVFYLLSKLEKGDELYLFYKGIRYKYHVTDKKMADPSEISYLNKKTTDKTLTLMTCWPPGTTLKRLIILGELK